MLMTLNQAYTQLSLVSQFQLMHNLHLICSLTLYCVSYVWQITEKEKCYASCRNAITHFIFLALIYD
ncbi:hypothetical protein AHAS_Ahas17G0063200 [Arachis hypogaea]